MPSSILKPLILYGHPSPNPWKVAIVLEELFLPYTIHPFSMSAAKSAEFVALNPNGRLPALVDPNNQELAPLWESGAIIEYLIAVYDQECKISYPMGSVNTWQEKTWLHFQMSGQGPYFGQAAWFKIAHPEKLPSAIERYMAEIERVTTVLDGVLKDRKWLVGEKCTYADLSFLGWDTFLGFILGETGEAELKSRYPSYGRWIELMMARPTVRKVLVDERKSLWGGAGGH